MKKYELVAKVAKDSGLNQEQVNKVIESTCKAIVDDCLNGSGEVNLPSLGKFKLKVNAARKGINPLTQKPMDVKETRTVAFRPTSAIRVVVE